MCQMSSGPWSIAILLTVGLLAVGAPAARAAEADEEGTAAEADARARQAAEAFESLYGQDLERVRGTSEAADDVALAKRLLAAAREATGTPALLAVLCENAYDLAAAHPDGYATAVEAAEYLASQVPEKAVACAERVAEVRQKQFAAAEGEAKTGAGKRYVDALLALAEAHVAAGTYPQAIAALKRAAGIARTTQSDRVAVIDARRKRAEFLLRTRRDITNMKALIARDPENTAAREKLVRLYLVHLDDPAAAAEHLEGVEDEALKKYVPAVGKGVEAAPELACVELGDWYRSLGESAPEPAKRAMFERAKAYYERFLSLHETEDLERTTATLALKKVEDLLADLAPAGGPATASASGKAESGDASGKGEGESAADPEDGIIKPGKWVDLLPLVDSAEHAVKGTWERRDGALAPKRPTGGARVMVPVALKGSYEIEATVVRLAREGQATFILPLASTNVEAVFGHAGGKAFLHRVEGEEVQTPHRLETGVPAKVHIKVMQKGDHAMVAAAVDGRPLLQWQGPQDDLSLAGYWRLPKRSALGFGVHEAVIALKSLRVKVLDGEARLLTPATPAADLPRDDEGFYRLVPDDDLGAWRNAEGEAPPAGWTAKDGTLTLERPAGNNLWTRRQFDDFVLDLEFLGQGNSGIFIRTADPTNPVRTGLEVQIIPPRKDRKPSKRSCGALYGLVAPVADVTRVGAWNRIVLTVAGRNVRVELNGKAILATKLPQRLKAADGPGYIGLQDHGDKVQFRNLRLKPLGDEGG